jgi:hypothetical protein
MEPARPIQLSELASIGPYFALQAGPPDPAAGWQPVSSVIAGAGPGGQQLGGLIDRAAARLGTGQRWVAASVLYQGWAARLTSIYAGSVVLAGGAPDLGAARLHYRIPRSAPVELLAWPLTMVGTDDGWRRLLDDHLGPLTVAVRRQVRIGGQLLLGNLASAMAGSLAALARAGNAPLDSLVSQEWAQPADLARYGQWLATPDGPRYARRTCCGYTQLPGGARCGDCSLTWRGGAALRSGA